MREVCYTVLDSCCSSKMSESTIKQLLEHGNTEAKVSALKEVIVATASGQPGQNYLMLLIRFVLPVQDHTVKKLLMMLWEVYPMTGTDGQLIKEMILVCDSMRRDLQHPNEYIRGSTLRFLCKLKQPEILEPLVGSVRSNLIHRRSYVRRNAVSAIYSIYKSYDYLIPDAPELIEEFLTTEREAGCKRNAFISLLNIDVDKAVKYLISSLDQVPTMDHCLQIIVVELIQKICRSNSHEKSGFIRCVYTLLDSKSQAVRYEAAKALPMLTGAPTAVKASISCYVNIVHKAGDITTRLVVLDRLVDMKKHLPHRRILQENVAHVLSLVSRNSDLKVKTKILHLITDLITENNVQQVVNVMKKECSKDEMSTEYTDYKVLLTSKLHYCYSKYPMMAGQVVPFFDDMLAYETEEKILLGILTLLREAAHKFESIRKTITERLKRTIDKTNSAQVYCRSLWILVEFVQSQKDLENIIEQLFETTKDIIEYLPEEDNNSEKRIVSKYMGQTNSEQHVINYEIEDSFGAKQVVKSLAEDVVKNTGYLVTMVGWCVTKAFLKFWVSPDAKVHETNRLTNKTMYIVASILRLNITNKNLDSGNRLENYLNLIASPKKELVDRVLLESRQALLKMLVSHKSIEEDDIIVKEQISQVDESVSMLHTNTDIFIEGSVDRHSDEIGEEVEEYRLDRVMQLTGLSDPVYCEVRMLQRGQHNISFHFTLLNRTNETLFNCGIELASSGDIVVTDKSISKTVEPQESIQLKINIRISLTGNSLVYGNIVYDTAKASELATVVLQDIPINVVDYMKPTDCSQDDFRKMWLEFEWENKVFLSPKDLNDLIEYTSLIAKSLNMKCLTGGETSPMDSRFLTANLHAMSLFGDRVIANLSLEKEQHKITGHIRLRARSQGIVLGMGDVLRYIKS